MIGAGRFVVGEECPDADILALQQVLGVMLPEDAQTSLYPAAPDSVGGLSPS